VQLAREIQGRYRGDTGGISADMGEMWARPGCGGARGVQLAREILTEVEQLGHGEVGRHQVARSEASVHELDDVEAAALPELRRRVARLPALGNCEVLRVGLLG